MLSKEFVQAVHSSWQAIGPDFLEACEACGEELTNEAAVEGCIDADRIVMYGGKNGQAAQDEFRALATRIGYPGALREATKSLRYPLV